PRVGGWCAVFGKPGRVDAQHAGGRGRGAEHPPPDAIGVPGGMRDEMLKGLVGDRLRDAGQHRLHRLSIAVAEHAVHVGLQREPLRTMAEAALKRFEPARQALNVRRRGAIDHRAPAYRTHVTRTRPSSTITKTFRITSQELTESY